MYSKNTETHSIVLLKVETAIKTPGQDKTIIRPMFPISVGCQQYLCCFIRVIVGFTTVQLCTIVYTITYCIQITYKYRPALVRIDNTCHHMQVYPLTMAPFTNL